MAKLLLGKEVADALDAQTGIYAERLRAEGIVPTLAVLRVGENPGDESYLRSMALRAERTGVRLVHRTFPEHVEQAALLAAINAVNADGAVHGALLLRPLPAHLRGETHAICNRLATLKDVDGMTDGSLAAVFAGASGQGFAPCTAQACMETLDHYGIDCAGKRAVVLGRSLVVGRPAAMLLLGRNATVTVCHTQTHDLPAICREADILISAAGSLGCITRDHVRPGQTVLDVSMNFDPEKRTARGLGGFAGDAVFDAVAPVVAAITPVPGGIGGVTASVLMRHTVESAQRRRELP